MGSRRTDVMHAMAENLGDLWKYPKHLNWTKKWIVALLVHDFHTLRFPGARGLQIQL